MTWGAYDIVIKYHSIYFTINKIRLTECTLSIFAVVDISDFGWKRSHTEGTLFCNTDSYPHMWYDDWHYTGGPRNQDKNLPKKYSSLNNFAKHKMFQDCQRWKRGILYMVQSFCWNFSHVFCLVEHTWILLTFSIFTHWRYLSPVCPDIVSLLPMLSLPSSLLLLAWSPSVQWSPPALWSS